MSIRDVVGFETRLERRPFLLDFLTIFAASKFRKGPRRAGAMLFSLSRCWEVRIFLVSSMRWARVPYSERRALEWWEEVRSFRGGYGSVWSTPTLVTLRPTLSDSPGLFEQISTERKDSAFPIIRTSSASFSREYLQIPTCLQYSRSSQTVAADFIYGNFFYMRTSLNRFIFWYPCFLYLYIPVLYNLVDGRCNIFVILLLTVLHC